MVPISPSIFSKSPDSCICLRQKDEQTNMEAIRKKMQTMKVEKDDAMDKADECKRKLKSASGRVLRKKRDWM